MSEGAPDISKCIFKCYKGPLKAQLQLFQYTTTTMAEPRRRWRTLLALGAGVAAAGSVYYIYRSWCEELEREARELEARGEGAGSAPARPSQPELLDEAESWRRRHTP